MKKRTKIVLAVAAVMLIVGATLVNIARGRGEDILNLSLNGGTDFSFNGGTDFSFSGGAIGFDGDQKGYTVCAGGEESFDAGKVRSLDLDWVSGSVSVEPYDGDVVLVREKAAGSLSEGQRMRWKLSGGKLSVLFCANGEKNVPDKALTVLLPRGLSLRSIDADTVSASVTLRELSADGAIDADTTSGAILVSKCACASLDADTVSGGVTIENTAVSGAIDLDTTSGAIRLKASSCDSLDADTVSGAIEAEGTAIAGETDIDTGSGSVVMRALAALGPVNADTISGRVELRFGLPPAGVDVSTTSGDVWLAFPENTVLDLEFDSGSGELTGSYRAARGGLSVDVDTASGDLTIESR